jgi:hypothetical protein
MKKPGFWPEYLSPLPENKMFFLTTSGLLAPSHCAVVDRLLQAVNVNKIA